MVLQQKAASLLPPSEYQAGYLITTQRNSTRDETETLRNPDITYGLFRRQLKGHLFSKSMNTEHATSIATFAVPRFRLNNYGRRAFSVAGPMAWNSLPDSIRDPTNSTDCSRRVLKTYLFARY